MSRSTLITGAGGQLGVELSRRLDEDTTKALGRPQLDVSSAAAVDRVMDDIRPSLVIHTAALTGVDACEDHRTAAYRTNVVGTWNVARAAARVGADLIYVSTNYVFDGRKLGPYLEYDDPAPLNTYGLSKLHGERAARQATDRLYVVRTSWLYSRARANFVTRLLELSEGEGALRYVGDQVANPTLAADLAAAILQLADTGAYGIHHLANEGATSWYGWAAAVLHAAGLRDVELEEIAAEDYERPAAIPANSELANEMARSVGITLRPWNDALTELVVELRA